MTLDGGWGYILSTVIGVVLAELFNHWRRHSDHKHGVSTEEAKRAQSAAEVANRRIDDLERDFLRYQRSVAEKYHEKGDQRDFEHAVFAKLDDIMKLINTKADKDRKGDV